MKVYLFTKLHSDAYRLLILLTEIVLVAHLAPFCAHSASGFFVCYSFFANFIVSQFCVVIIGSQRCWSCDFLAAWLCLQLVMTVCFGNKMCDDNDDAVSVRVMICDKHVVSRAFRATNASSSRSLCLRSTSNCDFHLTKPQTTISSARATNSVPVICVQFASCLRQPQTVLTIQTKLKRNSFATFCFSFSVISV